ncbi:hypothetical protein VTN00DRAFT_2064 [Thermoascus crustaceus]|uniref:uncharacterized protein n=1 Tax=Thermoascus crustaceus TaxID=5088 RepID=UPI0037431DE4
MSTPVTYLHNLRKGDLANLAEKAGLTDYNGIKKAELEARLHEHLSANRSELSARQEFADYYKRLSQPARISSPVKREVKTEASASGDEVKRPSRRKSVRSPAKEEVESTTDETDSVDLGKSPSSPPPAQTQTPGRPSLLSASLPPSPAVVTDAIDRQTTRVRKSLRDAWAASGIAERSDALRSALSSVKSIETLIIAAEAFGLFKELVPLRFLTTVPAVDAIHTPEFAIKIPDLFALLSGSFLAPFSLWLTTSLLLPLTFSYFFNLSLAAAQSQSSVTSSSSSHGTRRTSSSASSSSSRPARKASFDPLVFNITKALLAYLVYATHFTFWDVYSKFSIDKVNVSIPGHWAGLVTGAAIGAIGSVYEAILSK